MQKLALAHNYCIEPIKGLQIKPNQMINNDLNKHIKVRLTASQNKALNVLKSIGFNKSKFIRLAIEEKLYRDYRKLIKESKQFKYPF